eukprot:COSAG06_NODE_2402_length_6947_cov_4.005111_3_plen_69_part_00
MNVLHLFLSEACWRVESKLFPQLTEPGSCVSHGSDNTAFYTQADIKELVQFARLARLGRGGRGRFWVH